jgi:hypothetical protein
MAWPSDLCLDKDIIAIEAQALAYAEQYGSLQRWRDLAREDIETRLRSMLREKEILTDAADVLDLVFNYEALEKAASFLSLHYQFSEMSTGQDFWAVKAAHYQNKFDTEWPIAVGLLHFDLDESGTIDDTEKYTIKRDVRFSR